MDIRTLMTPDPVICAPDTDLCEVARVMRDHHIGDVLVGQGAGPYGIVTDRDLVVRGLAEDADAASTPVAAVCSPEVMCVDIDSSIDEVIALMERHSLRRIPVMSGGRPAGIVSIGDLAQRLEPASLLGEISSAPPDTA